MDVTPKKDSDDILIIKVVPYWPVLVSKLHCLRLKLGVICRGNLFMWKYLGLELLFPDESTSKFNPDLKINHQQQKKKMLKAEQ